MSQYVKDRQYYQFCAYGFLKNLRFFDAFLLLYLHEKGLTYTEIGVLYAVREVIINALELPSGIIADTFGRKNALAGSFLAYILSFILFYLFHGFWWLLAAFLLYGIGDAFRSGTHKGMIMDYLRNKGWADQKIAYYGHTRSWSQTGSAISSLIAGGIIFFSGAYEKIFLYSIIPYVVNFFQILTYPEDINYASRHKEPAKIKSVAQSFFSTIRQRSVLQIISSSAFSSAYLKAIKDYIQPIMVKVAVLTPILMKEDLDRKNGVIIGLIYFLIYLMTAKASRLASTFHHKTRGNIPQITLLLGLSLGLVCGLFYLLDWWVLTLIAFVGIYLIENLRKPIMTGYVANKVPNDILTSVISAQSQLRTIITTVIALSFGLAADQWGIGIALILVSGCLLLLIGIVGGVKERI